MAGGIGGAAGPVVAGVAGGLGGAYGGSYSKGVATSVSTTDGSRDLAASMNQDISSRTQQHATEARTRRATVVQETSEAESEKVSTRIVANYNHMHAMTIQYYEVVQIYEVLSKVEKCERILFIPLKSIAFTGTMVTRFKNVLIQAALTQTIRILLQSFREQSVWRLHPDRRLYWEQKEFERNAIESERKNAAAKFKETEKDPKKIEAQEALLEDAAAAKKKDLEDMSAFLKMHYDEQIANACAVLLLEAAADDNKQLFLPGDLTITQIRVDAAVPPESLNLKLAGKEETQKPGAKNGAYPIGKTVNQIEEISVEFNPDDLAQLKKMPLDYSEEKSLPASCQITVSLQNPLNDDEGVEIEYCIGLRSTESVVPVISITPPTAHAKRSIQLLKHLNDNRLYYSQAIFSNLPTLYFSQLLAGLQHSGKPVADAVDPQPVAVTGNYVGFIWNFENNAERKDFEGKHLRGAGKSEIKDEIALPSGGVFAEAVLGRFNCAEIIDPDRFWNWKDSEPTYSLPEIAAVSTASRAKDQAFNIDKFDGSLVTMQTPASLPAPTGLNQIIGALKANDLFRDMSGLQSNIESAKAALAKAAEGAGQGADLAAKNLEKILDFQKAFLANDKLIERVKPVLEGYAKSGGDGNMTEQIAKTIKQGKVGVKPGGKTKPGGAVEKGLNEYKAVEQELKDLKPMPESEWQAKMKELELLEERRKELIEYEKLEQRLRKLKEE